MVDVKGNFLSSVGELVQYQAGNKDVVRSHPPVLPDTHSFEQLVSCNQDMAVGKNKGLSKGGKKGVKKKV